MNIIPQRNNLAFTQRIILKEITQDTPDTVLLPTSLGTSSSSNATSSGTGPFSTIVTPLIKLVAAVSPGLAAWIAGNPSSAGTISTAAGTATANTTTKRVVQTIIETDGPKDPS